jgi:aryl-alcohol dehydrogenase-like predicted oxidoreductase
VLNKRQSFIPQLRVTNYSFYPMTSPKNSPATPRKVAHFTVQAIGLGCMNLDHAYGASVSPEQGERVLLGALDAGYNFFDTATLYGFGKNEDRLGQVLAKHRSQFVLASKCGMGGVTTDGVTQRVIDGRPATIKKQCEDSLRRLKTEVIDLYYLHRWDKKVPIEESVGALGDLVRQGKIQAVGLSEVSAATLRKAHAEHPIAAVQTEYSLWTRDAEIAVLQACQELGTAFVAFSPVARGYLCGLRDLSGLHAKDIRLGMPRFKAENYAANLQLAVAYEAIAKEQDCTPAQLALAWLLHKAPHIIPIPGTTSAAHMRENLAAQSLVLSELTMQKLDAAINASNVQGPRYDVQSQSEVDTESEAPIRP